MLSFKEFYLIEDIEGGPPPTPPAIVQPAARKWKDPKNHIMLSMLGDLGISFDQVVKLERNKKTAAQLLWFTTKLERFIFIDWPKAAPGELPGLPERNRYKIPKDFLVKPLDHPTRKKGRLTEWGELLLKLGGRLPGSGPA